MRSPEIQSSAPGMLPGPPRLWKGITTDTAMGRRVAFLMAALLLGVLAGTAIVHFPPVLIIGFVCAIFFVLIVMARPYWGLLLYTGLFLIRPGELYPVIAPLHLERVVGVVALAAMFLAQHRAERRLLIDGSRQTMLFLFFMVAVLCSIPFAYWRTEAVNGFVEVFKIAVFYILVVHLINTKKRLRTFLWLFSALLFYIAATAFSAYMQGSTFYAQGIDRAVGQTSIAGDPNQLGTTMAATIPLFLLYALHKPLRWVRIPFAIGLVLLVATLSITGSRASLLGFLAGLVYLWWASPRRLLVGMLGLMVLGAGFFMLPDQYKTRYSSITESELDESSQGRLDAWEQGLHMAMDRPLFGVGINCFGTAHALGYSPESKPSYLRAHSLYVQVLAELGFFGAVAFFAFMIEFLRLNRRAGKRLGAAGERWAFEAVTLKAIFAGLAVLLLTGLFGHSLLRRTWYIYAAIGISTWRIYLDDLKRGRTIGVTGLGER